MNFAVWLIIISCLSFLVYIRYLLLFREGLSNHDNTQNNLKEKVSVIIAARNEEKDLPHLLTALVNQSYPIELFEIIVADDGSTDRTPEIVNEFCLKWPNVRLLSVRNRETAISPKKNALEQAISLSRNPVILLTDADCLMGKHWISSRLAAYQKDTAMLAGFSETRLVNWKKAPLFQKFENFDFNLMFIAAAGAISAGKYFSCSGQNLSYRKAAFEKVGGFSKIRHLISGDDVNLMQLMRQAGLKIDFSYNHHSFVKTKPVESWQRLLNQRSRWASNFRWQFSLNPEFFLYLTAVFLNTFLPIILLFRFWYLGLGMILLRVFLEYDLIKQGYQIFQLKKNKLNFYPVWLIMQPVYILIVTFLGIFDVFRWKK